MSLLSAPSPLAQEGLAPRRRALRFWLGTLAALLGAGTTFALGEWQLSRAAQKEALQAAIEAQGKLAVLDTRSFLREMAGKAPGGSQAAGTADLRVLHRRASLRGTWVAGSTVFLDNRQMQARPGFFVVTPLRLATGHVILVQRGWVPRNFKERSRLPAVHTPADEVEVRGLIVPPPSKLYDFKGTEQGAIRQNLDLAAFRAETGLPLLSVSLQQTGAPEGELLREWSEADSGIGRNYGYAFQWFALCGLIVVLYVWFQFVRPLLAAQRLRVPRA